MPISKIKSSGIEADSVTGSSILDGTVDTADLANGAVTSAKITYPLTTFSSTGIDDNATSTSITLTSSNDVAFGNTSANLVSNTSTQGGGGYVASDEHFEFATSSNRAAVEIGKNNANDGQLVAFRKQSTTVGSIGSSSGALTISSSGSNPIRLQYNGNSVVKVENNVFEPANDGFQDLGKDTGRWKDLYLSGGVYLGGTGSANLLADYEEGTHVSTLSAGSGTPSISGNEDRLSYTKIGNSVLISGQLGSCNLSGCSGAFYITMPFVAETLADRADYYFALATTNNTSAGISYFYIQQAGGGSSTFLVSARLTNGTNNQQVATLLASAGVFDINIASMHYKTSS